MPTPEIPPLNGRFLSRIDAAHDRSLPRRSRRRLALQATAPAPSRPEMILGANKLLPFHFLRTGDRLGRAVVKILRSDGASGTGFLVAPDVLLTNHHVLPDPETAAAARVMANYEAESLDVGPPPRAIEARLAPGRLFVTQGELDFTFCVVLGLENLGVIPLGREGNSIGPSEVVNIIQHPRGRPKEVALQDNQVVKADRLVLHYSCDTEPGSSGSPVFDNGWRLVALHHASILADEPEGGRAAHGTAPDARFLNEGIRLSAIALWLETAETEADPDHLDRVLALFGGMDSRAGFFGALGRSARGRSAADAVAEVGGRGGETLDVAFWNLRAVSSRFGERLEQLGWLIAAMGMDIWCLAHITPAQARTLVEHLDSHFRLEYRDLPGLGSMAVLARTTRATSADWVGEAGLHTIRARVRDASNRVATVHLLPMPTRGPSRVRASVEAIGSAAGGKPDGDWLLIGGPSARLRDDDHDALVASGLDLSSADAGADGGLVLVRGGSRSSVARLFASPNLSTRDERIQVVRDRLLPEDALRLAGHRPISARLVLADR